MKHLRRFNESSYEDNQIFNKIRDCFLEFEDDGWSWAKTYDDGFSYLPLPHFKYIIKKVDKYGIDPEEYRKFDFTGTIDSNGEIKWEKKITSWDQNLSTPEFKDFLVAIKRVQDEIGLGFKFSFNNTFGEMRVMLQGKVDEL